MEPGSTRGGGEGQRKSLERIQRKLALECQEWSSRKAAGKGCRYPMVGGGQPGTSTPLPLGWKFWERVPCLGSYEDP
jgi:hypothetical protein